MIKVLFKLFLLFFVLVITVDCLAQDVVTDSVVEVGSSEDTGTVNKEKKNTYERHYMSETRLQSLRSKKAFQYPDLENDTANIKPQPQTSQKEDVPAFTGFDGSILLWLLVAVAVIILALQLSGINMRQLVSGKLRSALEEESILSENIHQIPFEKAISDAILARNFNLATRLMYLQSLKLLSDKNIIVWHENKTNWQYVYEVRNTGLRNSFKNITSIFDYVQYGNMSVKEEKFEVIQDAFKNFKLHVI